MRDPAKASVLALCVLACAQDEPRASEGSSVSVGSLTLTGTGSASVGDSDDGTGTGSGSGSGSATSQSASSSADTQGEGPKFDLAEQPDVPPKMPDTGCTKVDFLFVIDDSNSMATNQGELVASFPEFVDGIEATLVDVDSFHVGVVTSDAYAFNEPGCTQIGSLVTRTGGVNSSNSVCDPFADGARYMTENDNLANAFECAALVGTAGANDERMMDGTIGALSDALNMVGGCNAGFLRDDALLVLVLISDEDDPGSSGIGSAGDPTTWHDAIAATKSVETNVVVLTLTRGSPGNICDAPQGSEVDGTRLMQLAQAFGANGFIGDICAASFGAFFDDAVNLIETACENFEPPG
jgi:hypothetical protein